MNNPEVPADAYAMSRDGPGRCVHCKGWTVCILSRVSTGRGPVFLHMACGADHAEAEIGPRSDPAIHHRLGEFLRPPARMRGGVRLAYTRAWRNPANAFTTKQLLRRAMTNHAVVVRVVGGLPPVVSRRILDRLNGGPA